MWPSPWSSRALTVPYIALARGLAETTAGTGVTVNSVLAGPTRSESRPP